VGKGGRRGRGCGAGETAWGRKSGRWRSAGRRRGRGCSVCGCLLGVLVSLRDGGRRDDEPMLSRSKRLARRSWSPESSGLRFEPATREVAVSVAAMVDGCQLIMVAEDVM
jgi:hypothetical protein